MMQIIKKLAATSLSISMCCAFLSLLKSSAATDALTGMNAQELVSQMTIGWNLGNTLESHIDSYTIDMPPKKFATAWGNPEPTQELFETVKDAGFNTVRIPVTWYQHFAYDETQQMYIIDERWMDYVQKTVDYAYDLNLFVILNVHHEDWINVSEFTDYTLADACVIMEDVWEQIADTFAEYDQHLIFEGMNEPRQTGLGHDVEWGSGDETSWAYINTLNHVFTETVRSQGSDENAERLLILPGYCAGPEYEALSAVEIPENDACIALSAHAYKPYFFTSDTEFGQHDFTSPGPYGGSYEEELADLFGTLSQVITEKGVPIIIGEFGASDFNNTEDRMEWAQSYLSKAKEAGIPCVLWDNNNPYDGEGSAFGCLYRLTNTWYTNAIPVIQTMMDVYGISSTMPEYQEYIPPVFSWEEIPVSTDWIPLYFEENGAVIEAWDSIEISDWESYMTEKFDFVLVYDAEKDPYLVLHGDWYKVISDDERNSDFMMYFSYETISEVLNASNTSLTEIDQLFLSAGSSEMAAYALYAVPVKETIAGDVNDDGVFSLADLIMMQKHLTGSQKLADWQAGDLMTDGCINIFDLCQMKCSLTQ